MSILFSLVVNLAMAASPYNDLIELPKEMPAALKNVVERDFNLLTECEFKNSSPLFNEMFNLNESKNFDPSWFRQRITKVGADSRVGADAVFGRGPDLRFFLSPVVAKQNRIPRPLDGFILPALSPSEFPHSFTKPGMQMDVCIINFPKILRVRMTYRFLQKKFATVLQMASAMIRTKVPLAHI